MLKKVHYIFIQLRTFANNGNKKKQKFHIAGLRIQWEMHIKIYYLQKYGKKAAAAAFRDDERLFGGGKTSANIL